MRYPFRRQQPVSYTAVRLSLVIVVFLGVATAGACVSDSPAPTQALSPPPDIARYVTGAAAAALGPNGQFADAEPAPRERPIISPARARELSLGYVNSYAQFLKEGWEERHGAPINLRALRAAPRVFYAESPYGAFPDGPYHPSFRRGFGPYYLVTLMDGNVPVLVVGASAFNTDVSLDERGQVRESGLGGNEFMSAAVPRDPQGYRPLGPERAVERAARMTGARANGPPEFMLRADWHPAAALWKVSLDRDVPVRALASGRRRSVTTLYLDGSGRSLVAAEDQPDARTLDVPIGPPWERQARRTMPARIPVTPGRPVKFEVVVVDSAS